MNWFSTFGLILDIIGVTLLFIYVTRSPLDKESTSTQEALNRLFQTELEKKFRRKSRLGFCLVVIGFLLQLIGNNPVLVQILSY